MPVLYQKIEQTVLHLINVGKPLKIDFCIPGTNATMKQHQGGITKGGLLKSEAEHDSSCFSPRSLFAMPTDGQALKLDSFYASEGNSNPDQDLLLEVPSNSSFPQAELLQPAPSSTSQQASNNSSSCCRNPLYLR